MNKLNDFKKAVSNLEESLQIEKTNIVRDSAIKRFEICFDLAWKVIQEYAKDQGLRCYSPRECIKTAFELKLFDYDETWLSMISRRNESVHIYNDKFADTLYDDLSDYLKRFKDLAAKLV